MKSSSQKTIVASLLVVVVVAFVAWLGTNQQATPPLVSDDRVTVATSVFPLADITRNVGGEHVNVVELLQPGASPHSYTLTPRQLADIQNAAALFAIGHNLDAWSMRAVAAANVPLVLVDENIELREFGGEHEDEHEDEREGQGEEEENDHGHEEGSVDPHYWLTIPNGQEIAKTIAATLQEADPEHHDEYASNLQGYLVELDEVEAELQTLAQQANQTEFIAIHDAWNYFADHYGLELVTTYEPVEGREPSVRDIQELQNTIAEHNIRTFFTEPQKQSTGATRFLREDLGLIIKVLDPIGGTEDRESYIEMMRANLKAVVE